MEESVRINVKVGPSGVSGVFTQRQPGGMFLATDEVVSPGKTVTLVLESPDGVRLMQINAKVAWSRPPGANPKFPAGLGLRFKSISTTDVPTIEQMVSGLAPNGAPKPAAPAPEPAAPPKRTAPAPVPPREEPAAEKTPPPVAPARAKPAAPAPKPAAPAPKIAVEVDEDEEEPQAEAPPAAEEPGLPALAGSEEDAASTDTVPGFIPGEAAPAPAESLAADDPFAEPDAPADRTPPEERVAQIEESAGDEPSLPPAEETFQPPEGLEEEVPIPEGSPIAMAPGEAPVEETSFEPPPDLPVEEEAPPAEAADAPAESAGDFVDPTSPEFEAALGALGAEPAAEPAAPPAVAGEGQILCPSCGSPIAVGAHVMLVRCRNCGAKINPDEL